MKKEELARTLVLLGILLTIVYALSFQYEKQINSTDFQYQQQYNSVIVRYYPDHNEDYYNETLDLLPPDWLLELYNISLNKSYEP